MGDLGKKVVNWGTLGMVDMKKTPETPKPTLMMPDAEAVKRNERRKASKRKGGRTSTLLSQTDTLGV